MACVLSAVAVASFASAAAADDAALTRFSTARLGEPPPPWRRVTLPKITRHTEYTIVEQQGVNVLRIDADHSYANLVHTVPAGVTAAPRLRWRWRVDALSSTTDITRKSSDDLPARICVLFDLPLSRLSVGDRMAVLMGRALFDPDLPAATLCYVWDAHVAPGTWLPNAYTERVMMQVLRRGLTQAWQDEDRDLRSDFTRAFPAEAANGPLPRIAAIAISADGDNSGARSTAFVGDIALGE